MKRISKRLLLVISALVIMLTAFSVTTAGMSTEVCAVSTNSVNREGYVSYNGSGSVYGYTTNYVVYGGSQETVSQVWYDLGLTAHQTCTSYGIIWYECWGTYDGVYYGWIDGEYLWFPPPREAASPPVQQQATSPPKKADTAPQKKSVTPYSIGSREGQVIGEGASCYTSNYILEDGSKEVQCEIQEGCRITVQTTAYSHGITWLECWDTDSGEYYGWIDKRNISFSVTAAKTETTVETTVTETVSRTETTEAITTSGEEMAMAEKNDESGSDNAMKLFIVVIAVGLGVLVAASAVLIVVIIKKPKYTKQQVLMLNRDNNKLDKQGQNNYHGKCPYCGAVISGSDAQFCTKCGRSFGQQQ